MSSNNDNKKFVTFSEFIDSLRSAKHEQYREKKETKAADEAVFNEMKEYLIKYYQRVEVLHSFVDENGSVFDCIPIEQQSSLSGKAVPEAPDLPGVEGKTGAKDYQIESQLDPNRKDKFGNARSCPPGTIPVRRITLNELVRFGTLRHFHQKSPVGSALPPTELARPDVKYAPQVPATHHWAYGFQNVNNLGGHSFLNVWSPSVNTNQGQIFSLSQQWYSGGSGSNVQTAEVGWQVYPDKYGSSLPVFFIYWTADGYGNTGCYNLECTAFVQTNSSWTIGGTISPVSVRDGPQYIIEVTFYLFQGRWWLYVGGTNASNAIGFYPASIYNNGAMASNASNIIYGGEVVGTTSWPPMGSGAFAAEGWRRAAYQRDIYYFPTNGGASYASLASVSTSTCYTSIVTQYAPPWNETIFFGGPGGASC